MGYFGNDYRAGRKREFGPETQKAKGAFGFLDSNCIVSHSEYFCSVLAIFIFAMPCAAYGLLLRFSRIIHLTQTRTWWRAPAAGLERA